MSLLAVAAGLLILGAGLGAPELPPLIERAAAVRREDLSAQWLADPGQALPKGPADGVRQIILSPSEIDASRWRDALRNAPMARIWVMEAWPPRPPEHNPASYSAWQAELAGLSARAQAQARDLGPEVGVIPTARALAGVEAALHSKSLNSIESLSGLYRPSGGLNDRGLYLLAMVTLAVLTQTSPEGLPAQLTRLWLSRQSVVDAGLAAELQALAWQVVRTPAETAGPSADPSITPVSTSDPLPQPTSLPAVPALSPAPEFDLPALGDGGVTAPDIAFNLADVTDWSTQLPFLDLMKSARPWTGHKAGGWGGYDHHALEAGGWLDPQGWPRALPPDVTGISTLVLTGLPEDAGGAAGRYILRHQGRAELKLDGPIQLLHQGPGEAIFDYHPAKGGLILTLSRIDPADPVRAITLLREDRLAAWQAGEVFNPDWLERLRGTKLLRFMDWGRTNGSPLSQSAEMPQPSDYTWALKGVPVEIMLQLANTLKSDAWFTLPHLAEDALVRDYAQKVHRGLGPGLKAYLEYSNEVWNHSFPQAGWAEAQGRARWGQEAKWVQFYALRAAEIAQIWAEIFADDPKRLMRVLSTQTGWLGLERDVLDAPLVQAEGRPPPHQSFDLLGVTGYVGGGIGHPEKRDLLGVWLTQSSKSATAQGEALGLSGSALEAHVAAHRFDQAIERALEEMRDGRHSGQSEDTLAHLLEVVLPWQAAAARSRGLELVMYEGGTHAVGLGPPREEAEVTAFLIALNYAPGMGAFYRDLIDGWRRFSTLPFTAFVDVMAPTKYGSWGALRHLGDDSPRWRALAKGVAE